ncbi:hypothetical protein GCM10027160_07950 [Streptomyces calidiresistens]
MTGGTEGKAGMAPRTVSDRMSDLTTDLTRGFASLNLDPSPGLRRSRKQVEAHRPVRAAWRAVGRAIREGVNSVGRSVRN